MSNVSSVLFALIKNIQFLRVFSVHIKQKYLDMPFTQTLMLKDCLVVLHQYLKKLNLQLPHFLMG